MSGARHTPGPWTADRRWIGDVTAEGGDTEICALAAAHTFSDRRQPEGEEMAANARLIASAPVMLDALKSVQRLMLGANTSALPPEQRAAFSATRWQVDCAIKATSA